MRVALGLVALFAAWIVGDLWLPWSLPGAAEVQHQAFRALAGPTHHLLEEPERLEPLKRGALIVLGALLLLGPFGVRLWQLLGALCTAPQVLVVIVAMLMERALGLGIAVGVLVMAVVGSLPRAAWDPTKPGWLVTVGRMLLVLALGAAPGLYLVGAFEASSDGYRGLVWLERLTASGVSTRDLLRAALGVCALGGLALLVQGPRRQRALGWLAGLGAGSATAAVVALWLDPGLPWLHVPLGVAAGLGVFALGWPVLSAKLGSSAADPVTWPLRMAVPLAVAGLLFAHTYGARIFHCEAELAPELTKLADPGEVFQLDLGRDGEVLVMSLRNQRRWGRIQVQPEPGPLGYVDPGIVAHPEDGDPGESYAFVEEVIYVPERDAFLATALSADVLFYTASTEVDWGMHNMVVTLAGDGSRGLEWHGNPRECWIGKLAWDERHSTLRLGCEYEPQMRDYEPISDTFGFGLTDEGMGDVSGVAFHPEQDLLYTVSMWLQPTLAEIDPNGPEVMRRLFIGGTHYDIELDPRTRLAFISSYYRSEVVVVDVDGWAVVDRVPTGLGARPVTVDPERDLVLAASVYDGLLRAWRISDRSEVATLAVGGHVKDIALDAERGLAYFASRCGLFRLDLGELGE